MFMYLCCTYLVCTLFVSCVYIFVHLYNNVCKLWDHSNRPKAVVITLSHNVFICLVSSYCDVTKRVKFNLKN